ncbi:Sucrose nonfermenting 4-like protein [Platanthera guangdongensis]|uniref:Sucrose nonfermenting 4-like protein n=1 Tax=Platanthera guangdongensis TaxID=2320717 RepID=A0ABR2MZM2_9ASPA
MFSSGMDASQDLSGTVGAVLIPTRFVWPHGGRRVFLTGSFTRWSDHLPMSPVEGCHTVFQAICNLTPGLHQYKFYVDGEWRHDENQPYVSGNYGIVNSLFLTGEPDPVPSVVSPGTPSRINMDVDNENFRRVVTLSGCSAPETALRISEADIELTRHQISNFLSTSTSYDLLPDSGKVIVLDVNLPVKQAFHILYEQGIPVAPLLDFHSGQFVGMLSALDFILILREVLNMLTHFCSIFHYEKIKFSKFWVCFYMCCVQPRSRASGPSPNVSLGACYGRRVGATPFGGVRVLVRACGGFVRISLEFIYIYIYILYMICIYIYIYIYIFIYYI